MNEVLLIVLTWLPVVAESGLFVIVAKFLAKKMKDHFSTPENMLKEVKDAKASIGALHREIADLIAENRKLIRLNEQLTMKLKGFKDYDEEIKKN